MIAEIPSRKSVRSVKPYQSLVTLRRHVRIRRIRRDVRVAFVVAVKSATILSIALCAQGWRP